MRPVALVADTHVGNSKRFGGPSRNSLNQRCLETIETIRHAVGHALDLTASTFYLLGDIFDTSRPVPPMVAAVQDVLHPFVQRRGVYSSAEARHVIALVGNHDKQSSDLDDHALASVGRDGSIDCISETTFITDPSGITNPAFPEMVSVPYHEGDAREWLPAELERLKPPAKNAPRALCIHLGVYSDKYTAFIGGREARDAVPVSLLSKLMDKYDVDACFAGNWHSRKVFKTKSGKPIVQVGSLCPTGWSDKGLTGHGMTVWYPDTGAIQHIEVRGPRFIDLPRGLDEAKAALAKLEKESKHHRLYIRATAEDRDEMLVLREAITGMGGVPDIQLDKVLAQAAARTAATVAKSADSRNDALSSYIKAMEVADGVDRAAVLERCKRYLHG